MGEIERRKRFTGKEWQGVNMIQTMRGKRVEEGMAKNGQLTIAGDRRGRTRRWGRGERK